MLRAGQVLPTVVKRRRPPFGVPIPDTFGLPRWVDPSLDVVLAAAAMARTRNLSFLLILAAPLLLGGCVGGAAAILLQVGAGLASGSTLLKNEFNCSLASMDSCVMPRFTTLDPVAGALTGQTVQPTARAIPRQPLVIRTMEPVWSPGDPRGR